MAIGVPSVRLLALLSSAIALALAAACGADVADPSPEGKIAFTSTREGNSEVYIMSADGSGQANLTNSVADESWSDVSPNGSSIVFTSDRDGNWEVYAMDADGSGQTNLTNNPADDFSPAWSPDATRVAFVSNRDGSFELYVMNADGSDQTR
ncbi:unnamed protein product, partial [marine sediment metagenome]